MGNPTIRSVDSLVQTVYTFSTDIGMEFGIKKCGMVVLKRGKNAKMEGIVLPDGQVMKEIDASGYKYLGILETDQLKEEETKDLFSKEYKRRLKLVLKTKLGAGVVDWTGSVAALRKVSSHWILKKIDFNHRYCFGIVWGFGYRTNSLKILRQLLHDPIGQLRS